MRCGIKISSAGKKELSTTKHIEVRIDLRFTRHASMRLFERFSIDRTAIYRLLKQSKYIVLGCDKQREHWLMFSEQDAEAFVLVVNTKMKEIVTVLTTEHEGRCAIADDQIFEIRKLTLKN